MCQLQAGLLLVIGFNAILLGQLSLAAATGRILLYPYSNGLNSRLMNMERMAAILVEEGYQVTMLVSGHYDQTRLIPGVELWRFPTPDVGGLNDPTTVENLMDISLADFATILQTQQLAYCDNLLGEKKLLQKVKKRHFDLLILDYIDHCGRLLVDFVDVPTILFSNYGFSVEPDVFAPMPLAYSPMPLTPMSDRMTFLQRVRNVVEYGLTLLLYKYSFLPAFQRLRFKHHLNTSLSIESSYTRAQLLMVNTEFGFDYPRPIMPNVVTIGGLFNEPALPLEGELKQFVDTAPNGIVVVSFGSVIDRLERSKADLLARTFARLPFRFVWRLRGRIPDGLANNTMLMNWLPQNDLLGHPKTVAFVSHCGSSAAREAIYHAVPVVAIPMIIDQPYQATKLVENAHMAVRLDWKTLTQETLTSAIVSATRDVKYKTNAIKTSRRLKDLPQHPREKFTFWVDYLFRNKNADHLNSEVVHELRWYQYFLLDVGLFLTGIIVVVIVILKLLGTWLYHIGVSHLKHKLKML